MDTHLPGQALEENGQESVGLKSSYLFAWGDHLELIMGLDTEFTRGYLRELQPQPTEGSDFLRAIIPTGRQYATL